MSRAAALLSDHRTPTARTWTGFSTGSNFGANPGYSGPAGATGNTGWVDVNLDGRADYCRVTSTGYGYRTIATGTGFGMTFSGSVGSV